MRDEIRVRPWKRTRACRRAEIVTERKSGALKRARPGWSRQNGGGTKPGNFERRSGAPERWRGARSVRGFGQRQERKTKGKEAVRADGGRKLDGRVQPRMERTYGAIPLSKKATLPRASALSNSLVIRQHGHNSLNTLDKILDVLFRLCQAKTCLLTM